MRTRKLLIVFELVIAIMCGTLRAQTTIPQTVALFRKSLGGPNEIVVTQHPVATERFDSTLKLKRYPQIDQVYVISVEARSGDAPHVMLASTIWQESEQSPINKGIHVLDISVEPERVILTMLAGRDVALWRIQLGVVSQDAWAWLDRWDPYQVGRMVSKKEVKVDLTFLPDGHLAAAVTALSPEQIPIAPPTLYEQDGDDWRFKITRLWDGRTSAQLGNRPPATSATSPQQRKVNGDR